MHGTQGCLCIDVHNTLCGGMYAWSAHAQSMWGAEHGRHCPCQAECMTKWAPVGMSVNTPCALVEFVRA